LGVEKIVVVLSNNDQRKEFVMSLTYITHQDEPVEKPAEGPQPEGQENTPAAPAST